MLAATLVVMPLKMLYLGKWFRNKIIANKQKATEQTISQMSKLPFMRLVYCIHSKINEKSNGALVK